MVFRVRDIDNQASAHSRTIDISEERNSLCNEIYSATRAPLRLFRISRQHSDIVVLRGQATASGIVDVDEYHINPSEYYSDLVEKGGGGLSAFKIDLEGQELIERVSSLKVA